MALKAYVGSFLTGTGAAASTVAITGVGFTPKAIIFFGAGRPDVGTTQLNGKAFMGFSCTGIKNYSMAFSSASAAATSICKCFSTISKAIQRYSASGPTNEGDASVTTLGADGFTITIGVQFTTSTYVNYICLGGEDITNTDINSFTIPTTATTKAITGVGFKPDMVLLISNAKNTIGANSSMFFSLGCATRKNAQNGGISLCSRDAQANMSTFNYQRNGESIIGFSGAGAVVNRGSVISFDTDGFTISLTEAGGFADNWFYLAIKGGSFFLGNAVSPADATTTKIISGFNFSPSVMLLFSTELGECAADTPIADAAITIGAMDVPGTIRMMQMEDYDALATSIVVASQRTDGFQLDTNSTPTDEVLMTMPTMGPNGFTVLNTTFTKSSGIFFFYLAIGDDQPNGVFTDMWI